MSLKWKRPILGLAFALVLMALSAFTVVAEGPRDYPLGLVPSEGDFPRVETSSLMSVAPESLPSNADWSGLLPPVGNQGRQGSCVGWSVAYYYKSWLEVAERGWSASSSEHQFSPAFIYNQRTIGDCTRDSGMSFANGFRIMRDQGVASLAAFPYNQWDACTKPSAQVVADAWEFRIEGYANIFAGSGSANINDLKARLTNGQLFTVAVPVYDSFYDVSYANPVVPQHASGESYWGGHAMLVVGYDDAMGGFKTVNSWGPGWGRNGYCWLSYDFVQNDVWEAWEVYDYVADPEPVAGPVEVSLSTGWNSVFIPCDPSTRNVAELMAPIADVLDVVYAWNEGTHHWQRYSPSLPWFANTLYEINPAESLWIRVRQDTPWVINGVAWATNTPHADQDDDTAGANLTLSLGESTEFLPQDLKENYEQMRAMLKGNLRVR